MKNSSSKNTVVKLVISKLDLRRIPKLTKRKRYTVSRTGLMGLAPKFLSTTARVIQTWLGLNHALTNTCHRRVTRVGRGNRDCTGMEVPRPKIL